MPNNNLRKGVMGVRRARKIAVNVSAEINDEIVCTWGIISKDLHMIPAGLLHAAQRASKTP